MIDLTPLRADLRAEHAALDAIVGELDLDDWDTATPAEGWSVRDQISHLAFFDEQAALASAEPERFRETLSDIARDPERFMQEPLERGRALPPASVLAWWRDARAAMLAVFERLDGSTRLPWYGPPMSPASFITARLMETWAHGQDIVDALGISRAPTERLRHVAHLGVRARPNSYVSRGMTPPEGDVRVELRAPNGDRWVWNEDAAPGVTGEAVDFCLVVTQRRHLDDTDLAIEGAAAREWMSIAQAFAGPPGSGRRPGQFPKRGRA